MPRQKRKRPRSATDPQPPQLKRRRLVDDLERAPEEVIATRVDRYNRHHVFSRGFKLKDEFLTDPKTLSDIIAVGKRMEIEGTRYIAYFQSDDLLHPIQDFPAKVTDPFYKMIGPDKHYALMQGEPHRIQRRVADDRKDMQGREVRRLTLIRRDEILSALRLYDAFSVWSKYVVETLQSKPKIEALAYKLPDHKKNAIPGLLEDAERKRIILSIYNPLNTLSDMAEQKQLESDLRDKLVAKKVDHPKIIQDNPFDEFDLRERIVGNDTNIKAKRTDLRAKLIANRKKNPNLQVTVTDTGRTCNNLLGPLPSPVPSGSKSSHSEQCTTFCPERSHGGAHAQEVVRETSSPVTRPSFQNLPSIEELPEVASHSSGNNAAPCPERSYGGAHAQAVVAGKCLTWDNYGSEVGALEVDPERPFLNCGSFDDSCPYICPHKTVQSIRVDEFESSISKPLLTESYATLLKRDKKGMLSGKYRVNFGTNLVPLPSGVKVVLAFNDENLPGNNRSFFIRYDQAVQRLEELGFFSSIIEWNIMTIDVEGYPDKLLERYKIRNPPVKPFTLFHCASPNGVTFVVQCLFDGKYFLGHPIPNKVRDLLSNETIVKFGSGVSEDLLHLRRAFGSKINDSVQFGPSLEMSRLMLFLNPVEEDRHKLPPNGIKEACRVLGVGEMFDDPRSRSFINPVWFSKNINRIWDYAKNPRSYSAAMEIYNYIDVIIPYGILDRALIKLCSIYQFEDCPEADVSLPRLFLIALLMRKSPIRDEEDAKEAKKLVYAPTALFRGFNPFKKWNYQSPYPDPSTIMHNLRSLLNQRRVAFAPMIYQTSLFEESVSGFEKNLAGYVGDAESTYNQFKAVGRDPHFCIHCSSTQHTSDQCQDREDMQLCSYPLCEDRDHETKNCPTMTHRCEECLELGHLAHRHEEKGNKFDILIGMSTLRHFARQHRYLNIINCKEILPKIYCD